MEQIRYIIHTAGNGSLTQQHAQRQNKFCDCNFTIDQKSLDHCGKAQFVTRFMLGPVKSFIMFTYNFSKTSQSVYEIRPFLCKSNVSTI